MYLSKYLRTVNPFLILLIYKVYHTLPDSKLFANAL